MKIYDCFTFFNELDVVEIRLEELWNTVDYFVISESNLSHSGNKKEYVFENNKERFAKYWDKIRLIKVDDMPETTDSWVRERHQRKCLERGLTDLEPEDLVIVSDCDEVPRAEMIEMIKEDENDYNKYVLNIPQFHYRLNYMRILPETKYANIMVTRGRALTDPQHERELTWPWTPDLPETVYLEHGGWHLTYQGDDLQVIEKLQNFAHTEVNTPEMVKNHNIRQWVRNKFGRDGITGDERFEYVRVDDYYPKFITDNLDRFSHLIIPEAQFRVSDLYRE
jgi:hypothetical protein